MRATRLTAVLAAALAFLLSHASALALPTVNIAVWTSSEEKDLITVVEISGPGGGSYAFPDHDAAPDLADPDLALAAALSALGLPGDTPLGSITTALIATDQVLRTTVISNYNPSDNPDMVLGDPDDYLTWIAIGDEDVNVEVYMVTIYYDLHRLSASIRQAAQVPAPALGFLCLGIFLGTRTQRGRRIMQQAAWRQ